MDYQLMQWLILLKMNILEIYKKKAIIKTINSIKISKICNKFAILKNNEKEA
jgi:hypothetical protein